MDGMGRVSVLFFVTFVSAYCITLPVSYTTAFDAGWGAVGLWWGPSFGDVARLVVVFGFVFLTTDWRREAAKAAVRVE